MGTCTALLNLNHLRSWVSGSSSPPFLWARFGMFWIPIRWPWIIFMLLRWNSIIPLRRLIVSNLPSQCYCKSLRLNLSISLLNIGVRCRPLYNIPRFTFPVHAPSTWQPNALPLPLPPAAAPSLSNAQIQSLVQDLTALSLRRRMDQGVPLPSRPLSPVPPLPSPPSSKGGQSSLGHTRHSQRCHPLNPCRMMRMKAIQEVKRAIVCKGLAFAARKHYHQCLEYGWDLEHDVLGCSVCQVVDGLMRYCRSSVYHPEHSLHQCPWDGSCGH